MNSLKGKIPSEIGYMTSLTRLDFDDNYLTGSIPTEVGNLRALQNLFLYRNSLNGTLPSELAQLSSTLTELDLHGNGLLTGSIPTEYRALSRLNYIQLSDTMLTGNVDDSFCFIASTSSSSSSIPRKYDTLVMDCLDGVGDGILNNANQSTLVAEVVCSCCTVCCNHNGTICENVQ